MDRRESLKALLIGTVSSGVLLEACQPAEKKATVQKAAAGDPDTSINRMAEEKAADKQYGAMENFFTEHEMGTIAVLCDIIIPKDDVSGSATDAKVPEFIGYIVKEKTEHQTPLRGGLRWLDLQSIRRFGNPFRNVSAQQQIELVNDIAYPERAKPDMKQGVSFFNLMRNLTATGFYTSQIGMKDLGYMGNQPNQWNGVPDDVLKQYGIAYTEKELKECVSFT